MKDIHTLHYQDEANRQDEHILPPQDEPRRPIALLSLPNTGTDWLVGLLLRHNPALRYFREFFNPICNPKYEDELNRSFGCEMAGNYAMIAKPLRGHDPVLQRTWAKENHNFTKENYSAFKVDWFHAKFDCFVLYRRAELTLPGSRLPVKAWYDAMYCSLLRNRWTLEPDVRVLVDFAVAQADTIGKRLVAAFVIYYYKLLKDAHRLNVPVLDFDVLMQSSSAELAPLLRGLPAVADADQLALDLCRDRRPGHKDFGILRAEEFFALLTKLARKCGGDAVSALAPWQERETSFEALEETEQAQAQVAGIVESVSV
ncbi:MAG: hypothetical protein ACYC3I_18605 [Gemmataceae bacterium]